MLLAVPATHRARDQYTSPDRLFRRSAWGSTAAVLSTSPSSRRPEMSRAYLVTKTTPCTTMDDACPLGSRRAAANLERLKRIRLSAHPEGRSSSTQFKPVPHYIFAESRRHTAGRSDGCAATRRSQRSVRPLHSRLSSRSTEDQFMTLFRGVLHVTGWLTSDRHHGTAGFSAPPSEER